MNILGGILCLILKSGKDLMPHDLNIQIMRLRRGRDLMPHHVWMIISREQREERSLLLSSLLLSSHNKKMKGDVWHRKGTGIASM